MTDIIDTHPHLVQPEPNSGCWLWRGTLTSNNSKKAYGWVDVKGSKLAHRYSYAITCGEIPEGMNILHKCDNHICVNPNHLFVGTQKDNVADCTLKNRRAKFIGENHPRAKITQNDVDYIKSYNPHTPYGTIPYLMQMFSMSRTQIKSIRNGKSWSN